MKTNIFFILIACLFAPITSDHGNYNLDISEKITHHLKHQHNILKQQDSMDASFYNVFNNAINNMKAKDLDSKCLSAIEAVSQANRGKCKIHLILIVILFPILNI